jgi:hypothetical protein
VRRLVHQAIPGCGAPTFVCEGGGSPRGDSYRCKTCAAGSPDPGERRSRTRRHRSGIPGLRGIFCALSTGRFSELPPARGCPSLLGASAARLPGLCGARRLAARHDVGVAGRHSWLLGWRPRPPRPPVDAANDWCLGRERVGGGVRSSRGSTAACRAPARRGPEAGGRRPHAYAPYGWPRSATQPDRTTDSAELGCTTAAWLGRRTCHRAQLASPRSSCHNRPESRGERRSRPRLVAGRNRRSPTRRSSRQLPWRSIVAPPPQQQPDGGNATATRTGYLHLLFHTAPSWNAARSRPCANAPRPRTAGPSEFSWTGSVDQAAGGPRTPAGARPSRRAGIAAGRAGGGSAGERTGSFSRSRMRAIRAAARANRDRKTPRTVATMS